MTNTANSINQRLTPTKTNILVFFIVFALEMIGGVYIGYYRELVQTDAFARTANAYYVLFIKPPRFASIGLVWTPLPSILQLPLAALSMFWKPLVTRGIAAAIVTSSFAAASSVILYKAFSRLNISKIQAGLLIILYATNPFIFYYGLNGMSEMIFFFLIIYIIICMTRWIEEGLSSYITKIGFALALAFFTRYEAIPFAFAVGIGVLLIIFFSKNGKEFIPVGVKEKYFYAEGTLIVLYAPFLYSILLWILFNWVISGNPLYFLNSSYSNSAETQFSSIRGTPIELLGFAITSTMPFIPVFIAIIIARIADKRLFKSDFFILFSMVASMTFFHYILLIKGASYGWLRFFSYSLPICFAWIPYELSQHYRSNFNKSIAFIVLVLSLIVSSFLTGNTLNNPQLTPEEHGTIITLVDLEVAEYINTDLENEKILIDSFLTGGILLNVKSFDNIVTSANLNFWDALDNPQKYGITYILIPEEIGTGKLDAIIVKYPDLYENGVDWCTKVKKFDGYGLFKVIY
ncbi:MAG: hypothetical protein PHZ03_01415 [Syntrophomonas sp.]|nr:hypothetical protein [Syntrophomonas sp.]